VSFAELDALELDMGSESQGVPSYLQPDKEPDIEEELNLPSTPTGPAVVPPGRASVQVNIQLLAPYLHKCRIRLKGFHLSCTKMYLGFPGLLFLFYLFSFFLFWGGGVCSLFVC